MITVQQTAAVQSVCQSDIKKLFWNLESSQSIIIFQLFLQHTPAGHTEALYFHVYFHIKILLA